MNLSYQLATVNRPFQAPRRVSFMALVDATECGAVGRTAPPPVHYALTRQGDFIRFAPMSVRVKDVSKRYGSRWALARVSFEVPAGSTVLLTGENGAGKTTLLKVVATAMRPTFGGVELFGADAHADLEAVRRRVALVSHQSHLYFDLSARENLELAARLRGGLDAARVDALLERVALGPHAGRAVRTYSAGMKRRTAIARMLLLGPELVLLDEPFGQLDPQGVTLMEDIVRELKARGATLIIATHDVERGAALCDRHLHMSGGRLQRQGALA